MAAAPASPHICAVVVAYRSAEHLARLLPDLVAAVDGVVVVDQASDDDSARVAERHGAVVLREPVNTGFAAGVNRGVEASAGDVVLLVNPDVRWDAGALKALHEASLRHPGDVLGPVVRGDDGRLQPTRSGLPGLLTFLGEELLVPESAAVGSWPARLWPRWQRYDAEVDGPLLSGACLWIPRATWERVGPMDERYFMYREEMDWQLRARQRGVRTILVPDATIAHVRAGSSGRHDPQRARWLAASTRRFVLRWLPGWRAWAALALLAAGQALRWLVWSAPVLRGRPDARQRRAQHRAALVPLLVGS
ncbi:MAG: glycosyltransferase family 2 protein [Euzebyales bacterium]|jgi:GT2 family glycosyltransferase|nr:glycosyltransferase family 2 protein [Euzebyales bacterium]